MSEEERVANLLEQMAGALRGGQWRLANWKTRSDGAPRYVPMDDIDGQVGASKDVLRELSVTIVRAEE